MPNGEAEEKWCIFYGLFIERIQLIKWRIGLMNVTAFALAASGQFLCEMKSFYKFIKFLPLLHKSTFAMDRDNKSYAIRV